MQEESVNIHKVFAKTVMYTRVSQTFTVDILNQIDNCFCGEFLVHFCVLDKIPSPLIPVASPSYDNQKCL